MDGCSYFKFFFKVVLPLAKPILGVVVLMYAVGHWNSYFNALIYLRDRQLYPLQVILREILIQQGILFEHKWFCLDILLLIDL